MWELDEETNIYKKALLKSRIERDIKILVETEKRETYSQNVLRMYNEYEEVVFNLSEQSKNETIESIKRMSLGQRMKYQDLLLKSKNKKTTNV